MFFPAEDTAAGPDAAVWQTVILVLSHIGLPVLTVYLFIIERLYLGAHALAVFIFSDVYHLCRGGILCLDLTLEHARLLDHITANSACVAVLLTVMHPHPTSGVAAKALMPFVVAYAVLAHPFQPQAIVIIAAFVMLAGADRYIRRALLLQTVPSDERFDGVALVAAGVTGSIGLALFALPTASDTYAIVHAIWHVLITLALYFAAMGVQRDPRRPFWLTRWVAHCRDACRRDDSDASDDDEE
jgi:hypothetical protein